MRLAEARGVRELIICGDSRIIIQQLRGEIACRTAGLQVLHAEASTHLLKFDRVWLVHVKRAFNAAADYITSRALQRGDGETIGEDGHAALRLLNKLPEVFTAHASSEGQAASDGVEQSPKLAAVTTRSGRRASNQEVQCDPPSSVETSAEPAVAPSQQSQGGEGDEESRRGDAATWPAADVVRRWRSERIHQAQDEERWIVNLKRFLAGNVAELDAGEAADCSKLASSYEAVDGLLYFVGSRVDRGEDGRLASVKAYVQGCIDCQTGRGEPMVTGRSPGNLVATRSFQIIGMDHVPSLPKSHRGNTELLIWIDQHSGYVIASPNRSRQAQEVAESYERCVYRRFGASEVIRHDREAAFMSEVFKAFNRLIGQRSKATLAYRPQANGMTERMVQTIMRAVKLPR
ncbi:hypothetical protein P43SY_011960 [Pythium insidiosum]|uniref:Integrase catalytic domain-containing protein n=1 Tax=Pythium insidiosum TaxID=114742 RepID=A0AAD5Q550_PYTIN|nr:hypothetical protein P43SY_011960 [Pythium insidiosum]